LGPEGTRDFTLIADELKAGVIAVDVNEHYGWGWERLYRPTNKIAYILSHLAPEGLRDIQRDGVGAVELREISEAADELLAAIEKATGAKVEVRCYTDYPGIDHDSEGTIYELTRDMDKMLDFIFSKDAYVQLGNDNTKAPVMMRNDIGMQIETYPNHYLEKPANGLKVSIRLQSWGKTASVTFNREKETVDVEAKWNASGFLASSIKNFGVNAADVKIFLPRKDHHSSSRLSTPPTDDRAREIAMTSIHHLLSELSGSEDNIKMARDFKLTVEVEQTNLVEYDTPNPEIVFTGVMKEVDLVTLRAGLTAMQENTAARLATEAQVKKDEDKAAKKAARAAATQQRKM
jgi:hypothetical protein